MNYINLNNNKLELVAKSLNEILANYHIYYQKLRNYHWNIKGENFYDLHAVFEDLYSKARVQIDEIAERILTITFKPEGNFSKYLELASIDEPKGKSTDRDMVSDILESHKILIKLLRNANEVAAEAGDEGTVDLLGGYIRSIEKDSWMMNAWLTKKAS